MNHKNLVLTVLACLNCAHITYAVEKTPVEIQQADQNELDARDQFALFLSRTGERIKKPSMMKDALIQRAKIDLERDRRLNDKKQQNNRKKRLFKAMVKTRHKIDQYEENLKLESLDTDKPWRENLKTCRESLKDLTTFEEERRLFEEVVNIRHEIVQYTENLKLESLDTDKPWQEELTILRIFEEKLKAFVKRENITVLNMKMTHKRSYTQALQSKYPKLKHGNICQLNFSLIGIFSLANNNQPSLFVLGLEKEMRGLGKCPDLTKQMWDLLKINWTLDLKDMISKHNPREDIGGILEQLDAQTPNIGQKVKETVLGQMIKNLDLDKDTVLYQRTVDMLRNDSVLSDLIKNYIKQSAAQKMAVANLIKSKEKLIKNKEKITSTALKKLTKNVLMHCATTYLDHVPD